MRRYLVLTITLVAIAGCNDEVICFTGLGIGVVPHDTTITAGNAYQLSVVYHGCNGPQTQPATDFTWGSPNPGVAVVDSLGRVTGLTPGQVTFAVAARGGGGIKVHPTVTVLP